MNPPTPPPPTAEDRGILRDRLKALFKDKKVSGRSVEERVGVGRGTLSKVYSGKMALTHRLLHELSQVLDVPPEALVERTAFAHLLETAPPTPETTEVAQLKEELDHLRVEKQATDAALSKAHDDLKAARREFADADEARSAAEQRAAASESELAAARAVRKEMDDQLRALEEKVQTALVQASAEAQEHAAAVAKVNALTQSADQWRTHALEREQRVKQLEAYIQQLRAQTSNKGDAAVGGALLGMALGAMIASR
jgi:transcriptional regulator with XRE-family HTH domain